MLFREATPADIPGLHQIRMSVKENVLNNPALVTRDHYVHFLTEGGKGWLCEVDNAITGFAMLDLQTASVWALFVNPGFEKKGIGKTLHNIMLEWYFDQSEEKLWLTTAPDTRAETFYRMNGWKETGRKENGEIRFEMTHIDWTQRNNNEQF